MSAITEREQFAAVVYGGPVYRADAIVVLMGEDAMPRMSVAAQIIKQGGADVVLLTGGLDDEGKIGAQRGGGMLMGLGVAPDRIVIEPMAENTREQAEEVLTLALLNKWERLLLIASGYHLPRAVLTFLAVLLEAEEQERILLIPMPASHSPWFRGPRGVDASRLDLLGQEYEKIETYRAQGHVASFAQGLDYLRYWERRLLESDR